MNTALNLSVYCVNGKDATAFLQGQLTQDMETTDQKWKYTAHCNPKGRVINIYQTFKLEETHYLISPTELAEKAIEQIQKYIMRSEVVITKSSLGVYFTNNKKILKQSFYRDNHEDIVLSLGNAGFLKLSNTAQESNSQIDWDIERIQQGVPRIHPETVAIFTPEAINLDISDAVSFSKGCYTGQEIIARMHYLGKARQRLFLLSTDSKKTIKPNSVVTDIHDQKVGFIVDIDNNGNALASLKTAMTDEILFSESINFSISNLNQK